MEITPTTGTTATQGSSSARVGLADNFDSFLQLLTAQLKAQDPLSPLDANKFTEQLVQFSGVEQSIKTNEVLAQLVALVRTDQLGRAADYIGAEVEAAGQTVRLGGDVPATLHYGLDAAATEVTIDIYDETGQLVSSTAGDTGPGVHSLTWDGLDPNGNRLPDGLYRFEVSAVDAGGEPLPVGTTLAGIVDGVEVAGDGLMLSVGGVLVPLDAVTAIRRPVAAA